MIKLRNPSKTLRAIFLIIMALWPLLYNNDYALNVMVVAGIYAILALGFTILVGQAGQVSLGHAAFFGIGAYTCALLATRLNAPPLLALVAGAVVAGIVAYVLGRPVLRLKGFILALVTMGLGEIFYVLVREARWLTGGVGGISGIPWLGIGSFSLGDYTRQYYGIWALVLVLLLFGERAIRSRPGRAMRALSISEATAATLGIYTPDWKLVAFVVSGIYAGIAGGLYAFVISAIGPEDFGFMLSIIVIIVVMLGGIGSLFGAITGSILMTWLGRSVSGYQEYSGAIYSLVLILLVIFMPGGLAQGLRRDQLEHLRGLVHRWRRLTHRLYDPSHGNPPALENGVPPAQRVAAVDRLSSVAPESALSSSSNPARSDRVAPRRGELLLQLEGVSVNFGGLQALSQVSLNVRQGDIAALIGPNGAGKTTLFNTISGLQHIGDGRVRFAGQEITRRHPSDIARLGMARTFQSLHVFANMSVLENVMAGRHRHEKAGFLVAGLGLPWQLREEQESRQRAIEALGVVGLEDKALLPVTSLPYGQQRLVEIARAIATEPTLVLLDEPAAGLNTPERVQLVEKIERIRETGGTVLLVEHDMDLVMGISDTVMVLDYGKLIAEGTPEEVQKHPAVIEAYLGVGGHKLGGNGEGPQADGSGSAHISPRGARQAQDPMLEIDQVSTYYGSIGAVMDVSLRVYPGEIVAVLGANGAGKTTLLRTISGTFRPRKGRIFYQGRDISHLPEPKIATLGIGHIPEGRHVFPTLSVQDNLRMGAYRRSSRSQIEEDRDFVYQLFPVLAKRLRQVAGTLSGGEQQMLAIGRALMGRPQLLLLDEPSMGLAPLVVEQIFETLVTLNQRGLTLLMVEQNAEMALAIAHHAFVLQTGRVALSGATDDLRQDDRVRSVYLGQKQTVPKPEEAQLI